MSDLRTEEEQIEALKRWWDENGKQLLTGLVLAAVGWFGWNQYETSQRTTGEQAQLLYSELLRLRQEGESSEEKMAAAQLSATELKKSFPSTPYAIYASLFLARDNVEDGQMEQAEQELRWALKSTSDKELSALITGRLARVLGEQEKYDEALALVKVIPSDAYKRFFLEVRGDLYAKSENATEAKKAYDEALEAKGPASSVNYLEMKAADLAGAEAQSEVPPAVPHTEGSQETMEDDSSVVDAAKSDS